MSRRAIVVGAAVLAVAVSAASIAGGAPSSSQDDAAVPVTTAATMTAAATGTAPGNGARITDVYPAPKVTARSWLVYDGTANEIVAAQEPTVPRPIASLTKLMTAIVVLEAIEDLDEDVTIPASVNELPADAARMDARAGETWPAKDLLRAMLAHSANDAALALAAHVTDGDEAAFVKLMNDRAAQLEMTDSEFASSTGLDTPGVTSRSTPLDLLTLAKEVLRHPEAAAAVAEPEVQLERPDGGEQLLLPNRNPLLGAYPGVDGVKTGFTDAAGYMLIVRQVDPETAAKLIVITAASTSEATRIRDSRALLDWARPLRTDVRIVEGGSPLGSVPVLDSTQRVDVFVCDDLVVNARAGQRFNQQVVVPRQIVPPIAVGDEIGELSVTPAHVSTDADDAQLPSTVKVCAGDSVKERGRLSRYVDHAKDWRGAWSAGIDEVGDALSDVRERVA